MTDKDERNLWERINAVREEVPTIGKDKTVGVGGASYNVATHEAIKKVLRPLMAKHGLIDWIEEIGYERFGTGVTYGSSRRELVQHRGHYNYCIRCIREDSDVLRFPVRGDGEDTGDKGPGKASTYALKTGQRIVFLLSADDADEEGRIPDEAVVPHVEMITPEHIDEIVRLADDLFGDRMDSVIERMLSKVFEVESLKDLADAHHKHALGLLRNQHKREQETSDE